MVKAPATQALLLVLLGAWACGAERSPTAPRAEGRMLRMNEQAHCEAVKRIAVSMDLLPGAAEQLAPRDAPDIGDESVRKTLGTLIPSGFDLCALEGTRHESINSHREYRCRTSMLSSLDTAFDQLARTWRSCLVPPAWTPAARVRYANGGTSAWAGTADAYISAHFQHDPVYFSEGYCILRKGRDFIEMTCGSRTNN